MGRIFITLYALIVLAVLLLGWGLDAIWNSYTQDQATSEEPELLRLIEAELLTSVEADYSKQVQRFNQNIHAELTLIELDSFSKTSIKERIITGEIIFSKDGQDNSLIYKRISNQPYVLRLSSPRPGSRFSYLKNTLAILFFIALAVVIFVWVWPLSRDLRKLEKHTQQLGKDNLEVKIEVPPSSAIYQLAQAYNRMADRINQLINTHREMTHAVSHELRTPLARMKFALEMTDPSSLPEKAKENLHSVRLDVTEMDSLVNSLLNYASLEEAQSKIIFEPGDMPSLIQQIIQQIIANKPEHIELAFTNKLLDHTVDCEWHLMERAIINLLQNALRFAKQHVSITLQQDQQNFIIHVDDDGPGIAQTEREHIFNSFVRLRNSTNSQSSGFGLGLAIVKRVMQWHQGTVTVDTSPYNGCRFTLCWPRQQSQ